ncbi:hypothetical protein [Photobacterium kasasachensis]|uniref:hypothetical protein n=1 Tax=Photobacterium kasasachensis TaxID=2910240 RepID=UPI003D0B36D5
MSKTKILFVFACVFTASCISDLYSKPTANTSDDISTISEQFVKATRGGVLDVTAVIPGKIYHPRDGYISYERFWCIDEEKGSVEEYIELMAQVCKLKDGVFKGEWCVSSNHHLPLFSATIEQNGTTCTGGDLTTIIHNREPISSATASEWLITAEAFGFEREVK